MSTLDHKEEKLLEFAEDPQLAIFDRVMDLTDETQSIKKEQQSVRDTIEVLAEEIKKKSSELVIDLDPEEIRGPQGLPGKDGKPGERGPQGPKGEPGKDGHSPTPGVDFPLPQGEKGEKGDRGEVGERGPMPKHEWNGSYIRFELSDGKWSEWVNLQGMPGKSRGGSGGIHINSSGGSTDNLIFSGAGVSTSTTGGTTIVTIPGGSGGVSESLAIAYAVAL